MTMTPQVATTRIIRQLHDSEFVIDQALTQSANLLATVTQARIDAGEDAKTAQVAVMRLVQALTSLSTARGALVRAHGELRRVGETRSDIILPSESKDAANGQLDVAEQQVAA